MNNQIEHGKPGDMRCLVLILILAYPLWLAPVSVAAQPQDYNVHYQYPFSMAIEYQSLNPFASYGSDFNVYEVAASFNLPLAVYPRVLFSLQAGIGQYDARNYLGDGDKWNHSQLFAGLGVGYSNRFSRDFEIGLELTGGFSGGLFSNLVPGVQYYLPYGYGELGGRIALNPAYNLSVQLKPKLKYQLSLPPEGIELRDFDGLALGFGVSIHYRFGEDPDAATNLIRSLLFSEKQRPVVYAAMQSYYPKNPIGTIIIENKEKQPVSNLVVSFFQPGLMDAPTVCAKIDFLKPGESREVGILAAYNNEIFSLEGINPFSGEVITAYEYRNRAVEQRYPLTYDVHDRTALTWDDERKVAAFITPADSALRNYTSYIRQTLRTDTLAAFNTPLQTAMQVYLAMAEIGILYQVDPTSPFTVVQGNPQQVDSISLPRDTLRRRTGDCDDLTVLFCSLLETVGIPTAYITVPGHIFAAFNTGVPVARYQSLHPDRSRFIVLDGELWIPVEVTMVGLANFQDAWLKGSSQWLALDARPAERGFFVTALAQQVFRPVGLRETDLGLQYGRAENLVKTFQQNMRLVQDAVLSVQEDKARRDGRKQDYNQLGIQYAFFSRYADARRSFERALALDRNYLPGLVNQANLELISGNSQQAVQVYQRALRELEVAGRADSNLSGTVMLNLARAMFEVGRLQEAENFYNQAEKLVPEESSRYRYLASAADGAARAAQPRLEASLIYLADD